MFTLAPGLVEGRGEGGGGGNGDFKSWMRFENLNCIEQCPQINPQVFLKDCVCPIQKVDNSTRDSVTSIKIHIKYAEEGSP